MERLASGEKVSYDPGDSGGRRLGRELRGECNQGLLPTLLAALGLRVCNCWVVAPSSRSSTRWHTFQRVAFLLRTCLSARVVRGTAPGAVNNAVVVTTVTRPASYVLYLVGN